jgi:hypothetical protein
MHRITAAIEEWFELADRGTVVAFANVTGLPADRPLRATVVCPDGSRLQTEAVKEYLFGLDRRTSAAEAFLLVNVVESDIPKGSMIELEAIPEGHHET